MNLPDVDLREMESRSLSRRGDELRLLRDVAIGCQRAIDLPGALAGVANLLLAYLRQPSCAVVSWPNARQERQQLLLDGNDAPVELFDTRSVDSVALRNGFGERIIINFPRPGDDERFAEMVILFGEPGPEAESVRFMVDHISGLLSEVAADWLAGEDEARPVRSRNQHLIRKLADQVEHQAVRSHLVLDSITEAVFETDAKGIVLFASRSCARMFGISPEDLVGQPLLPSLAAGEKALAIALWRSLLRGEESGRAMRLQLPLRHAGGANLHAELNARRINHPRGDKVTYVCTVHDLSEQKAFVEQLERTNEKLDESLRMKDEFLACMSHELRTPLNSILGFAEILGEGTQGPVTESQLKSLRFISDAGRHLLDLINDLLDVSKIGAGNTKLHSEPTLLEPLLNAAVRMVDEQSRKKGISVRLDNRLTHQTAKVDSRRLRQILVNLLANAVKFTDAGGEVTVTARESGKAHEFQVIDTGIGIAAEHQSEIFQPFHQLDSGLRRGQGGTGLGLYLVRQLCELMDGSVSVSSEPGKGSCFTVRLPLEILPDPTPTRVVSGVIPTDAGGAAAPAPTVLLVEDDTRNLELLLTYLKAKGFPVTVAQNGAEACEKALELNPALILMDIQMPVMDGIEATSRITSHPDTRHIPIVAVTAQAMVGDRERCLAAGAVDYVTKPINLRELSQLITRTLSQK